MIKVKLKQMKNKSKFTVFPKIIFYGFFPWTAFNVSVLTLSGRLRSKMRHKTTKHYIRILWKTTNFREYSGY